ncbi:Protein ASPARTIC PROTEASE IN GUARD CELL 2 [Acorus calamus]|uniref:Protein ASPARTIC PROTEASE IN GUARD CELL 2 n=1 Tax=Acorus calamus TaxID=4465 RepID=A0AAV9C327_ACOCL|nr:Protein ASPARTIC PROTEASE IN GUARD CELL 2 [Acorus calamus]
METLTLTPDDMFKDFAFGCGEDNKGLFIGSAGIPPSVFSTAGIIVDSGTVITRLPPGAYDALRSAFQAGMSEYPTAPGTSQLDTCYDFSNYHTVNVTTVTLHFDGGADLEVDASGILVGFSVSQVCLAFVAETGFGIIGNTQQKTVEVVYDVGAGKLLASD